MSTQTASPKEAPHVETHTFQAETKKLLELMIGSLYTNKEIFLRELVSNASDALDRLRFESITDPEILGGDDTYEIRVEPDPDGRTVTIRDTGVGMSHDEVIENLGTIAKSGTRELMDKLKQGESKTELEKLIGQFGVGFYSAFMVADKVTVLTRRAGHENAVIWESRGDGEYTVRPAEKSERGTSITLHLKDVDKDGGIEDYADGWTLKRVIKRYSDFVSYPIILRDVREELETDENGMPTKDAQKKTVIETKTVNSMRPIWTRSQSEVEDEEYAEFYKHISHDWTPPSKIWRYEAEGRIEYTALLFTPKEAPYDLYYHAYEYGLQLYVRRVMVMDRCEDLLPRYLRFLKGVVDSSDLPLNISRQRLQEDRHITQIRRWLTGKVLGSLAQMKKDDEAGYLEFWEQYSKAIKEGLATDFDNKEKILPLVLWESSADPEKLTTLEDYVGRMQDEQKEIFYLTGESREAVESSPHLEVFKEKGVEVLYLVDPVDELVIQHLPEFDGKRLKSVGKGEIELGSEEEKKKAKEETEKKQEEYKDLLERMQKTLDEEIKQVRMSSRLTASPACLVGAEHDYSPQLEKLLMKGKGGGPKQRRILELNPGHAIVKKLHERFDADAGDGLVAEYAELLMGYALLAEGSELTDPVRFNQLLAKVLVDRL